MKTLKISQEEGKEGLVFEKETSFNSYEMTLTGKIVFAVECDSEIDKKIQKAMEEPDQDFDRITNALRGAALKSMEEFDFHTSLHLITLISRS